MAEAAAGHGGGIPTGVWVVGGGLVAVVAAVFLLGQGSGGTSSPGVNDPSQSTGTGTATDSSGAGQAQLDAAALTQAAAENSMLQEPTVNSSSGTPASFGSTAPYVVTVPLAQGGTALQTSLSAEQVQSIQNQQKALLGAGIQPYQQGYYFLTDAPTGQSQQGGYFSAFVE